MNLHLVIALVICMKAAAMASLISEVGNHGQLVTDAARSGTLTSRNLRSDVSPGFNEALEAALVRHAGQHFVKKVELPTLTPSILESMMETTTITARLEEYKLDWKDVNVLRNPNFHILIEFYRVKPKVMREPVFKKLTEVHRGDITSIVNTLNAGFMDSNPVIRELASEVEILMLGQWRDVFEWSPEEAFEKLNLNLIKDPYELYGNPAFATWLMYVVRVEEEFWYGGVFRVLRNEENSKNFKGLAEYEKVENGEVIPDAGTDEMKRILDAASEWTDDMKHIVKKRGSWHELVNAQAGERTS